MTLPKDQLQGVEQLSEGQLREGKLALSYFTDFLNGVVITDPQNAQKLAETAINKISAKIDLGLFVSTINFRDPDSVDAFIQFWETNAKLLKDLHNGMINPKDLIDRGYSNYPTFLLINPTNLSSVDEYSLGSTTKSEKTKQSLQRICKYGRVNIAISPDHFTNPGTMWPDVQPAYQHALENPQDHVSKIAISKYLYSRQGIKELGLLQKVEDSYSILTPTNQSILKAISL